MNEHEKTHLSAFVLAHRPLGWIVLVALVLYALGIIGHDKADDRLKCFNSDSVQVECP